MKAELQQARREIAKLRQFVDHAASYEPHHHRGHRVLVCAHGGAPVPPDSALTFVVSRARQLQLQRV